MAEILRLQRLRRQQRVKVLPNNPRPSSKMCDGRLANSKEVIQPGEHFQSPLVGRDAELEGARVLGDLHGGGGDFVPGGCLGEEVLEGEVLGWGWGELTGAVVGLVDAEEGGGGAGGFKLLGEAEFELFGAG